MNNDDDNDDEQPSTTITSLTNDFGQINLLNDSLSNNVDDQQKQQQQSSSIEYISYKDETQMPDIMRLIQKDLSEPYSIYTYRYFIHNWPQLCFLVNIIELVFNKTFFKNFPFSKYK